MSTEVVDLFAGPGGWEEGARLLGFSDEITGFENEPNACATAEAAGHRRVQTDIAAFDPRDFAPRITGLIGSPPCPGFSPAGKGLGRKDFELLTLAIKRLAYGDDPTMVLDEVRSTQHDERSALTLEPLRWILALRPEWVALEQVPQVLPLWQAYADALRPLGYHVHASYVHAEQYGVPQTRKRAKFTASLAHPVGLPAPTHSRYYPHNPSKLDEGVPRWVSMAEALGMGSDVGGYLRSNYGTGGDPQKRGERSVDEPAATVTGKVDRNHWVLKSRRDSPAWVEQHGLRENRTTEQPAPTITGESHRWSWQFAGAGATSQSTAGQVPRNLDQPAHTIAGKGTAAWLRASNAAHSAIRAADQPAPTMVFAARSNDVRWYPPGTTERGKPETAGGRHPDSRRVTVEEAAVLQSFRPDYPWQGKSGAQYQQVGNAVPPVLGAHILAGVR